VKTVPALFVIEFLHRVTDVFKDYFGEVTESALMRHCVIAVQVMEEMLDNGFPLATEPNVLKEMIRLVCCTVLAVLNISNFKHVQRVNCQSC
jgi:AP-3 complex subunit mu